MDIEKNNNIKINDEDPMIKPVITSSPQQASHRKHFQVRHDIYVQ